MITNFPHFSGARLVGRWLAMMRTALKRCLKHVHRLTLPTATADEAEGSGGVVLDLRDEPAWLEATTFELGDLDELDERFHAFFEGDVDGDAVDAARRWLDAV